MGKRKQRYRNNHAAVLVEMPASNVVPLLHIETAPQVNPEPEIERTFAPDRVNEIINHPSILPAVTVPGISIPLDMTPLVMDTHNFFLMAPGGCIVFIRDEPGIYEVHTNFLPEYRGRNALRASRAAYRWMFTRTDCMILQTRVPAPNVAADLFCRLVGATKDFVRPKVWPTVNGMVDLAFWTLHYADWVRRDGSVSASGHAFHVKLESERIRHNLEDPLHPDEECHDRYVGACVEMIYGGQPDKAVILYNRWAGFSGYGKIALIARSPMVLDIGDAVLQVLDHDFRVLKFK
jgi:hypothetical protein